MAELVPEDGTGLANANSYGSLAEADDYFTSHPYYSDAWFEFGEPERKNLLIRAAMEMNTLVRWRGYITNVGQGLPWPRSLVYDNEGRLIADNVVPTQVKYAQFEMAMFLGRGDPYAASSSEGVDRLKIDVIELEFSSSKITTPLPAPALLLLSGLGDYALGRSVQRVLVG
jgi:hypothetical protein